jgi:cobalt-zinc-cadmium efflux system outer membrane protein
VGVAERELAVRRAQLAERERRLRADVRMKAGEALAARRNLEVADQLFDANTRSLRLVEQRVREGANPALDEGLQRVEVNRLAASRALLDSRVQVATLQLKALAGVLPEAPMALRDDLGRAVGPPGDREDAVRRALAMRPDIEAARAEVAMGRAMVRKEEAEGRWDASVNVGYQRQAMGFGLNGLTASGQTRPIEDVFHFFGAGVSVVLPVLNRNQGNIAAARASTRAAERRVEFAELTARQEIEAAFRQHEAARRSLEMYERGVRAVAARNLDVVRRAYELGRGSLLDVIAEQRRYIEVENGYTEVLRQVYDAAVDIERALGAR